MNKKMKKFSWGLDKLVYTISVIVTLGMTYVLRIIITQSILDALEEHNTREEKDEK